MPVVFLATGLTLLAASPAFIAQGPFGDSPFAITDGTGQPIAYAPANPDDRSPRALSACPGGEFLVDGRVVRRISDLAQVATLGSRRWPGHVRCVRADGMAAVGFRSNTLSSRGELVRLTPGRTRTLARGPWALAALGERRSALAAVNPGGTLVVVDHSSARRRVIRRASRNGVDLELSPDERRVVEAVSKRRGERATTAFVHDLDGRSSLRRRIDGHDLVWYGRNRIAAVTYDNHARVYDARLRPVSKRFVASDGATFGAFGGLWWVRGGMLHRRGAEGYPVKLDLVTRGPLIPIPAR